MTKELDKMVENYFTPRNLLTKSKLFGLFDEVLTELNEQTETNTERDIKISFPKIRITEDFGKIGTDDRALIEKFAKNIPGATLEQKIAALNNILESKKGAASISEILSTMVMCEILSAIITSFTESAGGFIFEGFLAGLFGGKSVQIIRPEDIPGMEASGKPITDVILGDTHYSLKLLGETTAVKGSFENMINHFRSVDHIVYLDARRVQGDQGLEFGEFTITLENFLEVFVTPFLATVIKKKPDVVKKAAAFKKLLSKLIAEKRAIKTIRVSKKIPELRSARTFSFSPSKPDQLNEVGLNLSDMNKVIKFFFDTPNKELDQYGPFEVTYSEEKFEGTKAEKLFGSYGVVEDLKGAIERNDKENIFRLLELTPGYKGKQQFEFTRKQAEDIANFRTIGTLMIGPEYMKKTFAAYGDLLQQTISPVYEQLQLFTDNINDYFLGVREDKGQAQDRKQYAMDAIGNARQLEKTTQNAVEKIDK